MGIIKRQPIIIYKVPVVGTFIVDEDLTIWLNEKEIGREATIPKVKDAIGKAIDQERKRLMVELQRQVSDLNNITSDLEIYRVKATFG